MRGKFYKSRNVDMPTMLWFPEVLDLAENYDKWLNNPDNRILDYRNVWVLNPRNFGDSDHNDSFDLEDISNDVARFLNEKQLSMVTVGGHGYGAKVACAFGTYHMDKTTGVVCVEGGPVDFSYHEAWEEVKDLIVQCSKINLSNINSAQEVYKRIDATNAHAKWKYLMKQNLVEGKGSLQWKFNMECLADNVKRGHRCDITRWSERFGLFPGRSQVLFSSHSHWVFLNTNTIPIYKFFPRLEGQFGLLDFNYINTDENKSNHWIHELEGDAQSTLNTRITRWLKHKDGVHVLLADRSEVGWYAIPERESRSFGAQFATEFIPEHVHHNYKYTDAYVKSKQRRNKVAANTGEFGSSMSKSESW